MRSVHVHAHHHQDGHGHGCSLGPDRFHPLFQRGGCRLLCLGKTPPDTQLSPWITNISSCKTLVFLFSYFQILSYMWTWMHCTKCCKKKKWINTKTKQQKKKIPDIKQCNRKGYEQRFWTPPPQAVTLWRRGASLYFTCSTKCTLQKCPRSWRCIAVTSWRPQPPDTEAFFKQTKLPNQEAQHAVMHWQCTQNFFFFFVFAWSLIIVMTHWVLSDFSEPEGC